MPRAMQKNSNVYRITIAIQSKGTNTRRHIRILVQPLLTAQAIVRQQEVVQSGHHTQLWRNQTWVKPKRKTQFREFWKHGLRWSWTHDSNHRQWHQKPCTIIRKAIRDCLRKKRLRSLLSNTHIVRTGQVINAEVEFLQCRQLAYTRGYSPCNVRGSSHIHIDTFMRSQHSTFSCKHVSTSSGVSGVSTLSQQTHWNPPLIVQRNHYSQHVTKVSAKPTNSQSTRLLTIQSIGTDVEDQHVAELTELKRQTAKTASK